MGDEAISSERDSSSHEGFKWPSVFVADEVRMLVEAARRAARGPQEERLFASILRRAHDEVLELEILYADLPGVLEGVHDATESFRRVLDGLVAAMPPISSSSDAGVAMLPSMPIPNSIPCGSSFLVRPDVIFYLTLGIDRIAHGDAALYEQYVNALDGLWRRTALLDRLHRHAREGKSTDGRFRLAEDLRLIARGLEGEVVTPAEPGGPRLPPGHGEGLPGGLDFPGDGLGVPPGLGFPPPDGPGDPWPGPDDGPGIPGLGGGPGGLGGPPSGWPPRGPGGGAPGGGLLDLCNFFDDLCRRLVRAGARGLRPRPMIVSTWADSITSLSPAVVCEGELLTIHGNFTPTKPPNVSVIIGNQDVPVVSWSATAIVIRIPADQSSGCVGFRDENKENARRAEFAERQGEVGGLLEGLGCLAIAPPLRAAWLEVPYFASSAPCTPFNFFAGSKPTIVYFRVNGAEEVTVEPGTGLTLTWEVAQAETVRIRLISPSGPACNLELHPVLPATTGRIQGSQNLGAFNGSTPVVATYELTALNRCTSILPGVGAPPPKATVTVRLRRTPALKIANVEVVQTIQTAANGVPLVARKRTIVRVSVDSGLTDGFDFGGGANTLPGVTGGLTLWSGASPITSVTPLNPGEVVTAKPVAQINRATFNDTLNFELPFPVLNGTLTVGVRVWVKDPSVGSGAGWFDQNQATLANFQQRPTRDVVRVLIADGKQGFLAPSAAAFDTSLQGARTRYPIAEDGFVIHLAPGNEVITTTRDLTNPANNNEGWSDLLEDLDDLADDYDEHVKFIWAGLVPTVPAYRLNGIANSMNERWWPLEDDDKRMLAQAAVGGTFPHEMGHTFGLAHSNNCLPAGEAPDSRLTSGSTEDVGLDVPTQTTIPAGRGDIMSYRGDSSSCPGATRWPSIAFWNVMFNMPS
jgi:IPT/TIG domain